MAGCVGYICRQLTDALLRRLAASSSTPLREKMLGRALDRQEQAFAEES